MRRIDRLIGQARAQARAKGHRLGPFRRSGTVRRYAEASCGACAGLVTVCDAPMPGEELISGSAWENGCPKLKMG